MILNNYKKENDSFFKKIAIQIYNESMHFYIIEKKHLKNDERIFFKTKRPFIFTIIIELIQNFFHNENFYLQKILNKKTIKLWYKLLNKK